MWSLLGECQSKAEHIAGIPLRPDIAEKMHQLYLAKGALGTTAIEGNTLSEAEALKAVEGTLKLPPSRAYLAQEINNILAAYNQIIERIENRNLPRLDAGTISFYNTQVLADLELDGGVVPGRIRTYSVGVGHYRGAPAEDCEYLLNRLGDWLSGDELKAPKGMEMMFGILRAILAHLYIAWIHPFGDGNGRTARLVEYQILLACGIPTPAVHLLSNFYNQTRNEYYRQLERASASNGDYIPFVLYAVQGMADGLREQIETIRDFQLDVIWRNYIHEAFREQASVADKRRRDLALDLSNSNVPVKVGKIVDLSPRLATYYAGKGKLTIQRDLNVLKDLKLISRSKEGSVANKAIVEAFLPFRVAMPTSEDEVPHAVA